MVAGVCGKDPALSLVGGRYPSNSTRPRALFQPGFRNVHKAQGSSCPCTTGCNTRTLSLSYTRTHTK